MQPRYCNFLNYSCMMWGRLRRKSSLFFIFTIYFNAATIISFLFWYSAMLLLLSRVVSLDMLIIVVIGTMLYHLHNTFIFKTQHFHIRTALSYLHNVFNGHFIIVVLTVMKCAINFSIILIMLLLLF